MDKLTSAETIVSNETNSRSLFDIGFEHYDASGNLVWSQEPSGNQIADEGWEQMFGVYFRAATAPDSSPGFEVVLLTASPTKTTTVGTMTELSGTGYPGSNTLARSAVGFPTLALDSGDMQISAAEITFTNSGGTAWTTVTDAAIVSKVSASRSKFVCWKALSTSRTLQPSDTLKVTVKIKGQVPS